MVIFVQFERFLSKVFNVQMFKFELFNYGHSQCAPFLSMLFSTHLSTSYQKFRVETILQAKISRF